MVLVSDTDPVGAALNTQHDLLAETIIALNPTHPRMKMPTFAELGRALKLP
jgi:hypothetical protein